MVQVSLSRDVMVKAIWLDFNRESRCRFRALSDLFRIDRLSDLFRIAFPRKQFYITDHRMVHNGLE